jgi:hypothetical protein
MTPEDKVRTPPWIMFDDGVAFVEVELEGSLGNDREAGAS